MPISHDPLPMTGELFQDTEQQRTDPTFLQSVWEEMNTVGSTFAAYGGGSNYPEPNFDPYEKIEGTTYMQFPEAFVDVHSQKDMEWKMDQIDRQQANRKRIAEAGWMGVIGAAAVGTLDPTFLIPGAIPFVAARTGRSLQKGMAAADAVVRGMSAPSLVKKAGELSSSTMAMDVALSGALGAGVQESLLWQTQPLYETEDFAFGVGAATVLGGILGKYAGFASKKQTQEWAEGLYNSTRVPGGYVVDQKAGAEIKTNAGVFANDEGSTVGAARNMPGTDRLKDDKYIQKARALGVGYSNLTWNMLMDSPAVRRATAKFSSGGMMKADAETGVVTYTGATVEAGQKADRAFLAEGLEGFDSIFMGYRTGDRTTTGIKGFARTKKERAVSEYEKYRDLHGRKLSHSEFRWEVGEAMANKDRHAIPEVAEAAKLIRETVIKPFKERAQKQVGPDGKTPLLSPELDDDYFTRLYLREKIAGNRSDFAKMLRKNFELKAERLAKESEKIDARQAKIEARVVEAQRKRSAITGKGSREARKPLTEEIERLRKENRDVQEYRTENFAKDDADLGEIVEAVIENILGNGTRMPNIDVVANKRGPLQARVLQIDDDFSIVVKDPNGSERVVAFKDYLNRDVEDVMHFYTRTMSADLNLARVFDGDINLKNTIAEITDEKVQRATRLGESDLPVEKRQQMQAQLEKDYNRAIQNLEAFRDRIRGVYKLPDNPDSVPNQLGRLALNLNYLRLLGGMTISAFPDIAKHVMVNGLGNTVRALSVFATDINKWNLSKTELKRMGVALDLVLDSRTKAMIDLYEDAQTGWKINRVIQGASSKFGIVSLMAPWNAVQKQLAGITTVDLIVRATKAVAEGSASKKQIARLANVNIDTDTAKRMWNEFRAKGGGENVNGVYLTNLNNWKNANDRDLFRAAVVQEVDRTIVTPGLETPNFMKTGVGRMLFQFKSFGLASVNQTLISGLQQRDANFMGGVIMAIGLGMMAGKTKAMLAGRETDNWSEGKWLAEGIDRSGVLGIFSDANNIVEKLTRNQVGLAFFTGEPASRYQSRNLLGALMGPTGGLVQDAGTLPGSLLAGDWKQSDTRRVRQLLPWQNLFLIRNIINSMELGANRAMGIPITQNN